MKTVGFIGLGTMGKPMAKNLINKGYPVTVFNRTTDKTIDLMKMGADVAGTPADVARSVNLMFTMISDDDALKQVYYGKNGIMNGVHPGLTIIDCSTVSPDLSRSLSSDLAARYVDFLDAPVTGSKPAAISGTLTFMVGGKVEVMNENIDAFKALGSKILHMGSSGSGSQAKIAHNTIVGINMVALTEGMSIAAKAGIDMEKFIEVVLAGGAGSKMAELKGNRILDRDFSEQFSLQLMLKDLNLSSDLTGAMKMPTPMLQAARTIFQMAAVKGLGHEDLSSVIQCYEEWIHLQVKKKQELSKDKAAQSSRERRRDARLPMGIKLQLSVYQWEQEGAFSGQNIEGTLDNLSENGLQITSRFPLAEDMFLVIHFPQGANLPPITGKILRVYTQNGLFHYGCSLAGLAPFVRLKLEEYIETHMDQEI
ncbi:MAG TPA: NAD(P)-binding domain-containing protein [Bacilli bacterium]